MFSLKRMEDIYETAEGKSESPHRHNYFAIIWPTKSAAGFHLIDFNKYPIKENGIFFIRPGQVHQLSSKEKTFGFVLLFTHEFLQKSNIDNKFIEDLKIFNSYLYNEPLFIDDTKAKKLLSFIYSIEESNKSVNQFRDEIIGSYLKLFLIECTSVCDAEIVRDESDKSKLITDEFKKLVEQKFCKEHKVKFYADKLVISGGHLNHTIKSELGLTAKEYIQQRIILEAKRLLLYSDFNAKETAFELGFIDPHHFSKFFKNQTNQSITEFIQNNFQQ